MNFNSSKKLISIFIVFSQIVHKKCDNFFLQNHPLSLSSRLKLNKEPEREERFSELAVKFRSRFANFYVYFHLNLTYHKPRSNIVKIEYFYF